MSSADLQRSHGQARAVKALLEGELEVLGQLPYASNYTFLARLKPSETLVVYKPRRGEIPLWDFPSGTLCNREVAAFEVCRAAGWTYVPETILRDGPAGEGAVQLFIDHDPNMTALDLAQTHGKELREIAAFDIVINNADRKAGHIFIAGDSIHAVDHGICFHAEPKLRTVLWDFIGQPLGGNIESSLTVLLAAIDSLNLSLSDEEVVAMKERASRLLQAGRFPEPGPERSVPWPPI